MKKAILYIHGKGGSYLEAEAYKKNCAGFDIIGVDYKDYFPWSVEKQIKTAYDKVHKKYKHICLLANSIGAYFAMYALQNCQLEKALFISPVLDMERLILDMLEKGWNGENFSEITNNLRNSDPYMVLADFKDYRRAQHTVQELYKQKQTWNRMSLMNISNAGIFSADRSIMDYARDIWGATPVK